MALPSNERMDLHVHPALKAIILAKAQEKGLSLNEMATELFCKTLRLSAGEYRIPRKTPGRKPKEMES